MFCIFNLFQHLNILFILWVCPNCKRRFKNPNQDHSCIITEEDHHFYNKEPYVRDLFDRLMNIVCRLSDTQTRYVKHGIMISSTSTFIAIKPNKERLDIELLIDKEYHVPPVYKTFRVSKHRVAHYIKITDPKQIDNKLKNLIIKSYKTVSENKK